MALEQADAGFFEVGEIEQAGGGFALAIDAVEAPQDFEQGGAFGSVVGGEEGALGFLLDEVAQIAQLDAERILPPPRRGGERLDSGQLFARGARAHETPGALADGFKLLAQGRLGIIGADVAELGRQRLDGRHGSVGGSRLGRHGFDVHPRSAHGVVGCQHGFFELE